MRERPVILIVGQEAGTRQLRARSLSEPIHLPRKKPTQGSGPMLHRTSAGCAGREPRGCSLTQQGSHRPEQGARGFEFLKHLTRGRSWATQQSIGVLRGWALPPYPRVISGSRGVAPRLLPPILSELLIPG